MMIDNGDIKLDPTCQLFRDGDPEFRSVSFLESIWVPSSCAFIGFMSVAAHNATNRRPVFSGIQRYGIFGLAGVAIGMYLDHKKHEVLSEKDLQYYHYMTLHPEDFAATERIKYKDYLTSWIPYR